MSDNELKVFSPKRASLADAALTKESVEVSLPSGAPAASDQPTPEAPEETIFTAAQRGDIELLAHFINSGKAKATDRDGDNITPLHWAAINAHLPACQYLLDQGAEVDAVGGDLIATPMLWAARNGLLYIIQLLISHNADPTLMDSQGYNTLHIVTHSSNVMSLLYILQQPIAVDSGDVQGHTALMWAAYQGDAISIDILIKHGASVDAKDLTGMTPLHWAVVRGNRWCIKKLIDIGAKLDVKDEQGKTPRDMAVELKSIGAYRRALQEAGFDEDGRKKSRLLNERNTRLAIFVIPATFLYMVFKTISLLPWYTGVPLAAAEFFGMHHIVSRVILEMKTYTDSFVRSPYFVAIIMGTLIWVGQVWLTTLAPYAEGHAFLHLAFAVSFLLCSYNFFRAVTLDPGRAPKPSSESELRSIIEELASTGRLNGMTFCVDCMARKPLRSKHCRVCDRCTARFDHHCPWVWNCVGVNNHRQFIVFVTTLVFGVTFFDILVWSYFSRLPAPATPAPGSFCVSWPLVCSISESPNASFVLAVACWISLQLIWTVVLLAGQLFQIARQMTTLELSNLGRYGFMGGRGLSLVTQQGHQQHDWDMGEMNDDDDPNPAHPHPHHHGHRHGHRHGHGATGCWGFLLNVLGFDRFTKGKAADGFIRAGKASNPFDTGIISNCMDFWTKGKEIGVEYEQLYDVPPEGFKKAMERRRRVVDEEDMIDPHSGKIKGIASRYIPGLLGARGPRSNAYQAVSMNEDT